MGEKKISSESIGLWKGIETKVYKTEGTSFKNIVRRTLIDKNYPDVNYELRYFEIVKGGYSSFEKHEHTHTVIIVQGTGKVVVGQEVFMAKPLDVFYVAPWNPHQLIHTGEEPLGFFCIVPKDRDRPLLLSEKPPEHKE